MDLNYENQSTLVEVMADDKVCIFMRRSAIAADAAVAAIVKYRNKLTLLELQTTIASYLLAAISTTKNCVAGRSMKLWMISITKVKQPST